MTTTRAGGSPAYVAAHAISVIQNRLPFEQAFCLAKLVFDHAGGPAVPEREGPISLKLCKTLAAQDLVVLTGVAHDTTPITVRLTVPESLMGMLPPISAAGLVLEANAGAVRRKKIEWFAEVTQQGLDLVASTIGAR